MCQCCPLPCITVLYWIPATLCIKLNCQRSDTLPQPFFPLLVFSCVFGVFLISCSSGILSIFFQFFPFKFVSTQSLFLALGFVIVYIHSIYTQVYIYFLCGITAIFKAHVIFQNMSFHGIYYILFEIYKLTLTVLLYYLARHYYNLDYYPEEE